jgi:hypothetical protein
VAFLLGCGSVFTTGWAAAGAAMSPTRSRVLVFPARSPKKTRVDPASLSLVLVDFENPNLRDSRAALSSANDTPVIRRDEDDMLQISRYGCVFFVKDGAEFNVDLFYEKVFVFVFIKIKCTVQITFVCEP